MTHNNRGRLTVDSNGNWRLYSHALQGFDALGTIRRGDFDVGALMRNQATGIYVQANAGAIRSLDQRKIKVALGDA
jgi:hypothetical protein